MTSLSDMTTTRKSGQRLMGTGYASILRMLQVKPRTSAQVADGVGCAVRTTTPLLKRMAGLGLVHVVDRIPNQANHGTKVPVYAFGPGLRVVSSRSAVRCELVAFASLIKHLVDLGPATARELAIHTGLSIGAVRRLVIHCRSIKLFRVADWYLPVNGMPAMMLGIGSGAGVPRPAKQTYAEACKKWYYKNKAAQATVSPFNAFQVKLLEAA